MVKISIIVPVYNTSLYLEKCINSLIIQTFESYEIIIVNDGSTDNSPVILKQFEQNSKIRIFNKENGGLSDARNFGMQKASGDYFAFVDSDDWVETDFLEKLYSLASKHNADIVICSLQKVDENGIVFNKLKQLTHLPEKIDLKNDFSLFGEASSFACNKLFKRELFNDLVFPKNLHFEDIATIPILFLNSRIIAKTNDYLYNYFERRGSISQSFNEKGMDMFKAVELVKEKFDLSIFSANNKEWKRFVIYQVFYSLLAYIARVKNLELKQCMYSELVKMITLENISKKYIFTYSRLNRNYLLSLPFKKMFFYLLILTFPKFALKITSK